MWTTEALKDKNITSAIEFLKTKGYKFNNSDNYIYIAAPGKGNVEKINSLMWLNEFLVNHLSSPINSTETDRQQKSSQSGDARSERRRTPQHSGVETVDTRAIFELKQALTKMTADLEAANRRANMMQDRAIRAEARIAILEQHHLPAEFGDPKSKYGKIRRLVARELHPDHSKSEGIEKIVRAEIFKDLWPKIESIDRDD